MSKKMSYVGALSVVLSGEEVTEEVRERLEALKASLEKRASRKAEGPTKAQRERAEVAEKVFSAMVVGKSYGSADIAKLIPEIEGASSQKVTALMKGLVADGRVTAETVKGKKVYTVA